MAWTSPRTWVTGETVTAAQMNTHVRDNLDALNPLDSVGATSWTPTMEATSADDTVGSSTGRYWRIGPMVYAEARWVSAAGNPGGPSGTFLVALPVASSGLTTGTINGQCVGSWIGNDSDTGDGRSGGVLLSGASEVRFKLDQGSGGGGMVTGSAPWTWAANDVLSFAVFYPAA